MALLYVVSFILELYTYRKTTRYLPFAPSYNTWLQHSKTAHCTTNMRSHAIFAFAAALGLGVVSSQDVYDGD